MASPLPLLGFLESGEGLQSLRFELVMELRESSNQVLHILQLVDQEIELLELRCGDILK